VLSGVVLLVAPIELLNCGYSDKERVMKSNGRKGSVKAKIAQQEKTWDPGQPLELADFLATEREKLGSVSDEVVREGIARSRARKKFSEFKQDRWNARRREEMIGNRPFGNLKVIS